ncbi:hypothetical protein CCHR01_16455 [Colletotrichum chrysophilum]|uniref:Uncharacterized protein n=1 Tax=Colletotrichum chrysophilum TaxID=1836956 RepID=A0AAD9A4F0_9PEZI|nr:hypothetical protein CCHR01_16455 [Colletotrichum chrysophilum]
MSKIHGGRNRRVMDAFRPNHAPAMLRDSRVQGPAQNGNKSGGSVAGGPDGTCAALAMPHRADQTQSRDHILKLDARRQHWRMRSRPLTR